MPKSFSMMMVFAPNRCFSMCNIFRLYIFKKFKYYINLCLNNWFFMSIHHVKSFLRLIDLRIAIGRLYLLASEYHKGNCKEYMSWDQMKYIKISYSLSSETSSSKLNPNHILPCIYLNKSLSNSSKLSSKSYPNHRNHPPSHPKYRQREGQTHSMISILDIDLEDFCAFYRCHHCRRFLGEVYHWDSILHCYLTLYLWHSQYTQYLWEDCSHQREVLPCHIFSRAVSVKPP